MNPRAWCGLMVASWAGAADAQSVDRTALLDALARMASEDAATQIEGAARAGGLHHPVLADPLRAMLAQAPSAVRVAAARALGELGIPLGARDLSAMTGSLLAAARDADTAVALAAVEAAARYPFPEIHTKLSAIAAVPATPKVVRDAIARVLAEPAGAEAQARLTAWLAVSRRAAPRDASERWGVPSGELVLVARDLLDPAGAPDRMAVVAALASWPRAEEALPFLVRALEREAEAEVRRTAVVGLARIDHPRADQAIASRRADPERAVRLEAARALRVAGRPERVPSALEWLGEERDAAVHTELLRAIQRAPIAAVIDALERRPSQSDRDIDDGLALTATATAPAALLVRWLASAERPAQLDAVAQRLAPRSDAEIVPLVLERLTASTGHRRARLLDALDGRDDPRIAPALVEALAKRQATPRDLTAIARQPEASVRPGVLALIRELDPDVRMAALAAARYWRGDDVVAALEAALQRSPTDARPLQALIEHPPSSARTAALVALAGSAPHVRWRSMILGALEEIEDPRVGPAIEALVEADPGLAEPAIRVLTAQREAAAVSGLARIAGDPRVASAQRLEALRLVASRADHERAVQHLLANARDEDPEVKLTARRELHRLDPDVFPEWDPYGRIPLVALGAGFGAASLLIVSDIADATLSPAFTAGAGAVLGAATPFLATMNEEVSLGDAAYFGTLAGWGTIAGWGFGRSLGLDEQGTRWLTLAGETIGLTTGALTMSSAEWGLSDALLANTTALEAALTAATFRSLYGEGAGDAAMIAGALATVPMAFLARELDVAGDVDVVLAMMGHGLWLGAFAPAMFGREGAALEGAVIGQGFGYAGGLVLAHALDLGSRDLVLSFLGTALGATTLGGLGLSIEGSSAAARAGLVEAGSLAGVLAVGLLADRLELHENDGWIIGLGGLLGAVGGARLDVRAARNDFEGSELAGNAMLGLGLGVAGGVALSQLVDASDAELARTLAGGAVLAIGGAGLGRAIDGASPEARSLITGGALLGGMLLTAPFAERLTLDGATLGFGAISGASLAAWASQVPQDGSGGRATASGATGLSLGFAGGLALAQVVPIETGDLGLVGAGALLGSIGGASLSLLAPELSDRAGSILFQSLGAAGLIGATALAASREGGALLHGRQAMTAGAFLGAHGAVLGGLVAPVSTSDADAERVAGGALLGASIGLTSGVLLAELGELRLAPDVMIESTLFTAAAHGLGGGVGLVFEHDRLAAGLMDGLGLAALVAGIGLAPHTRYDAGDHAMIAALTAFGAWHGGWGGSLGGGITDEQHGGAVLLGASLGLASGLALAPLVTIDPFDVVEAAFIAQAASALAGGLAWSIDGSTHDQRVVSLQLAGAAGLVAGSFLAAHTSLSPNDHGLLALGTALGAAQAVRAGPLFGDTEGLAHGMTGAGAGFLGALALGQLTEVEPMDQVEIALVSAAANAVAGGVQLAAGLDARTGAALGTAAGLGALTAGALLAPATAYSFDDRALVGVGALAGALEGFLIEGEGGGALIGAGAGWLGAMALSQAVEIAAIDQVEAVLLSSAGHALGAGLALTLDDPSDGQIRGLASGLGLATLGGAMIAAPHTHYTRSDYGLLGLGIGLGAWHGAWLTHAIGENRGGSRTGGVALIGAGGGVLLGSILAGLADVPGDQQLEALAMWGYGSAIGGGLALTQGTEDRTRTAVFVEAGGMAGLAGAVAMADSTRFERGDALLVGALGVAGAWHGSTFPILTGDDPSAEARGGGALLGAGVFALGGHLLAQVTDYDGYDVAEIFGAGLLGNAMGFGLGRLVTQTDDRARVALVDGIGLASMGAMMALAPSIHIDRDTWIDGALFGTLGAALGGVLPVTLEESWRTEETVAGGALLGASLGLGASVLLGDTLALDGGNRQAIAFGATAGALAGTGLGLALSEDERWAAAMFEGFTLAGAAAVGLTADRVDVTLGDVGLGALWTGYLTWHQLGITLLTGGTDRQAAGLTMATLGAGALSSMYLAPKLRLKGDQVLMLFAGSVWGSWIGGWTGRMVDRAQALEGQASTGTLLLASVLGSDVGLGLTSLVLTGVFDVEPMRFAVINLAGLGGMMVGMLAAGFAQEEPFEAGNVIGSLAGLGLGALVTSFIDFGGPSSPYEAASVPAPAPSTEPGPRAPFSVSEWFPTAKVEPGPDGAGERYMVGIVGLWD